MLRPVRSLRAMLVAAILAPILVAVLPAAGAARDDGTCDLDDLDGLEHSIFRVDGSVDSNVAIDELEEGDTLVSQTSASLDCEDAFLTVVAYARDEDGLVVWNYEEQLGGRLRPSSDFTFFDTYVELPPCEFRVEVILGTLAEGRVIDSTEGGTTNCRDMPPPDCVDALVALAEPEGVRMQWHEDIRTRGVRVERAEGAGDFATISTLPRGSLRYLDDTAIPGTTYRYRIVPFNDRGEADGCAVVEVTAVPFFGAPLAALATLGALAAYARARRRT